MKELSVKFTFDIGDLVYFRAATHDSVVQPSRFVVVGQFAEQCSGGVQLTYALGERPGGRYHECELTAERPPLTPLTNAQLKEIVRIDEARRGEVK